MGSVGVVFAVSFGTFSVLGLVNSVSRRNSEEPWTRRFVWVVITGEVRRQAVLVCQSGRVFAVLPVQSIQDSVSLAKAMLSPFVIVEREAGVRDVADRAGDAGDLENW